MPPPEIPHRIREQLRRREDRQGGLARAARALPPSLLKQTPPSWPVDEGALAAARTDSLAADVEALLNGSFTMLGRTWPAGARTDWTLDPETGERWPDVYTFDIDFRIGGAQRDVKLAWELGRLQHLQLLATQWRLTGDARCRDACLVDLQHWIDNNPPYRGIAYASGIELACRAASILTITGLLGPATIEGPLRAALWTTLSLHGAWLARYPSLYSSANNHRVAELGGLALLGCLAPELPDAAAWREEGLSGLVVEALRQILPDGVGVEQTPTYQAFTMEWLLVARRAAVAAGLTPDPRIDARLAAGADFLTALHDEGGHHPAIGDDDEGVVLRNSLGHERHARSITRAVAATLERPELTTAGDPRPDLRAALLGLSRIPLSSRRPRARHFAEGGYTILRQGDTMAVMDHAPLGQPPLYAHGHADALAVWLHRHGQPVLIEAGTHRYNGAPDWRRYARSTLAHNTASVDGAEQSDPSSGFAWARVAEVRCVKSAPAEGEVEALHYGFAHLGVIHRRRVSLDTSRLHVVDDFESVSGQTNTQQTHQLQIAWHFAPDLTVQREDGDWVARRGDVVVVRLSVDGGLSGRIYAQPDAPGPGVYAPSYNRVQPAPTLVLEGQQRLPARISAVFHFS